MEHLASGSDEDLSDEEAAGVALVAVVLASQGRDKRKRPRRWWVRPCFHERDEKGQGTSLVPLLRSRDVEYYRDFLRMPPSAFDTILDLVRDRIKKEDTNLRKAIPPDVRLALTIRFLGAGETLRSSSFNFLIGRSTCCGIVSEVCTALWEVLGPLYVACPEQPEEWKKVAADFEDRWNVPNCIGAIDGKHVIIECPKLSGSLNHNYKGSFSKSLLAISDARYRFLYVEIGHHGSESDGGIFARSQLQRRINCGEQGLPPPAAVGEEGDLPYFLLGDEAFPLKPYLMRPYPRKSLIPTAEERQQSAARPSTSAPQAGDPVDEQLPDDDAGDLSDNDEANRKELRRRRKIFNYRLSRGRRVVENAFGILAQKWRILRRPFRANEENTDKIVAGCVVLHNFLLKDSEVSATSYCPPGTADHEDWEGRSVSGSWRGDTDNENATLQALPRTGYNSTREAYRVRAKLTHHFVNGGAVPWQDTMVMGPSGN
ncbi:protein ALP1-like isoform X2 [Ixodes scapularis]